MESNARGRLSEEESRCSYLEDLADSLIQHLPIHLPAHLGPAQEKLLLLEVLGAKAEVCGVGAQHFAPQGQVGTPAQPTLTPLMMCWGGMRTTILSVSSSFWVPALMASMGDMSGDKAEAGGLSTPNLSQTCTAISTGSSAIPTGVPRAGAEGMAQGEPQRAPW